MVTLSGTFASEGFELLPQLIGKVLRGAPSLAAPVIKNWELVRIDIHVTTDDARPLSAKNNLLGGQSPQGRRSIVCIGAK